jgi:hypothetical protein
VSGCISPPVRPIQVLIVSYETFRLHAVRFMRVASARTRIKY